MCTLGKEENKLEQETSFVVSEDNKKITFTDIEGEKMYVEVLCQLTNKRVWLHDRSSSYAWRRRLRMEQKMQS